MLSRPLAPYAACLLAVTGLVACGSPTSSPGWSAGSSAGSSASATVSARLSINVVGTTITPAPAQVDLPIGTALELVVTIDRDDELHAHGFEVEQQLKAGVPTTMRLVGEKTGVYEVETHDPALTLLTVAVR